MSVSDYKNGKKTKKQKKAEKERQERRNKKRELNVRRNYGRLQATESIFKMQYRVLLVRTEEKRKSRRFANITGIVESASWIEEGITLQGSINTIQPRPKQREDRRFSISDGNLIKLEAKYGGKWRNVWTMRVNTPVRDLSTDSASYTLADDTLILAQTKGDFKFVKDKKTRPKGWKAHQVAREVAKQFDIPLGHIAKGDEFLDNIEEDNISPLEVIAKAYKQERDATGKRFVMEYRHGRLSIRPLRRNKHLWSLREQILSGTVTKNRKANMYTVLHLIGHVRGEKDKDKRKIDVTLEHHRAVRRFGKIVKEYKLEHPAESKEKAIIKAKRRLARQLMKATQPTISISHPGIPWIRRGDAVEIRLPEYGYKAKPKPVPPFDGGHFNIVFVTSASHTLDSSGHMMDLEFGITDPVGEQKEEIRKARDKERRKKKREKRNGG